MNTERNTAIVHARMAGETLQAIANRYGLTRERIRQIVVRHQRDQRKAAQIAAVSLSQS